METYGSPTSILIKIIFLKKNKNKSEVTCDSVYENTFIVKQPSKLDMRFEAPLFCDGGGVGRV